MNFTLPNIVKNYFVNKGLNKVFVLLTVLSSIDKSHSIKPFFWPYSTQLIILRREIRYIIADSTHRIIIQNSVIM